MSLEGVQTGLNIANTAFGVAGNADPTIKVGHISGEIAGAVITTFSSITDQKQRAQFEQAFNMLSASQQQQIGEKLLQTNDELEKLQILSSALVATKLSKSANATQNTNRFVILGISIIFVVIIITGVVKRHKLKTND